jgi:hypothetical protein
MDVAVCGAVPPYNELLVGKLVALLMASEDIRETYRVRYKESISQIASQMAGRPVVKSAELLLLTTTSLYGVGSSQYSRLRATTADNRDVPKDVRWVELGATEGFGTIHLSRETVAALRQLTLRRHGARRINNLFGEGTSPRLRQVREGLEALGLSSTVFLQHATPRLVYGCELVPGARDRLMGLTVENDSGQVPSAKAITDAWRHRWLVNRIQRPETIQALSQLGPKSVRDSLTPDAKSQTTLPFED